MYLLRMGEVGNNPESVAPVKWKIKDSFEKLVKWDQTRGIDVVKITPKMKYEAGKIAIIMNKPSKDFKMPSLENSYNFEKFVK